MNLEVNVGARGWVVGGVNDSVWPYWTVCLDHTCLASMSMTSEAAETTSYLTRVSWYHHKNKQGDSTPDNKSRLLT